MKPKGFTLDFPLLCAAIISPVPLTPQVYFLSKLSYVLKDQRDFPRSSAQAPGRAGGACSPCTRWVVRSHRAGKRCPGSRDSPRGLRSTELCPPGPSASNLGPLPLPGLPLSLCARHGQGSGVTQRLSFLPPGQRSQCTQQHWGDRERDAASSLKDLLLPKEATCARRQSASFLRASRWRQVPQRGRLPGRVHAPADSTSLRD